MHLRAKSICQFHLTLWYFANCRKIGDFWDCRQNKWVAALLPLNVGHISICHHSSAAAAEGEGNDADEEDLLRGMRCRSRDLFRRPSGKPEILEEISHLKLPQKILSATLF